MTADLHGADLRSVERAIETGDPFTGNGGYAGVLGDGRIVRDVLGRYPVFIDNESSDEWAFSPTKLEHARSVPAGTIVTDGQLHRHWRLPTPDPDLGDTEAVDVIGRAIRDQCKDLTSDKCALGFSGGIDSTLLAGLTELPRYTVGFPDERDVVHAEEASALVGGTIHHIALNHDRLERAIPIVARATGRTNAMDVAIGCSLFLLAEQVARDGFDALVLGQGADELFGGYEKIAQPDHRVAAATVRGARREVLEDLPDGLERDVLAVRAGGIEPIMPYLGDEVVSRALRLDESQILRHGRRKWTLREVARSHLPNELVDREKTAIQYGNGVAKELDRLARQAGYKRRMDQHVDRYVQSLLDTP